MKQGICCHLCAINLEILLVVPSYQEKLCMWR